jgi:hypothetical protein
MRQNISAMLANELQKAVARETAYQQAQAKALTQLNAASPRRQRAAAE